MRGPDNVAGYRIAAFTCVAELVKSFDYPSLSKVLTTSATKLVELQSELDMPSRKRKPSPSVSLRPSRGEGSSLALASLTRRLHQKI